jgi:hypothetical protein
MIVLLFLPVVACSQRVLYNYIITNHMVRKHASRWCSIKECNGLILTTRESNVFGIDPTSGIIIPYGRIKYL